MFIIPLNVISLFLSFPLVRMKNHEKSKKHREMVALLRQQLEEEEDSLGLNLEEKEGGQEESEQEEEEDEDEEEEKPRQKYVAPGAFDRGKKLLC